MTDPDRDLARAEARLLEAACAYVDEQVDDPFALYIDLEYAVECYRAALRALPADEALVERGMAVVRRLLAEQEKTT